MCNITQVSFFRMCSLSGVLSFPLAVPLTYYPDTKIFINTHTCHNRYHQNQYPYNSSNNLFLVPNNKVSE